MGLQDRFRIDELVKKGSTAIRKDSNGNILVSKKDGKQKNSLNYPHQLKENLIKQKKI